METSLSSNFTIHNTFTREKNKPFAKPFISMERVTKETPRPQLSEGSGHFYYKTLLPAEWMIFF